MTVAGRRPRSNASRGYALILGGATLFGVNTGFSKVALSAGIEPARLAALRCTGTALGLLVLLALTEPARLRVRLRELPVLAVLGLSGAALIQWLFFVAIDRLPVGIAMLLEFTGPLMVAVYSGVVLRQPVRRHVWLALGLTLGGLGLVAQVWRDSGLDPLGVAAGLGAAVCLATYLLLGKRLLGRRPADAGDPMPLTFWTLTFWTFAFSALFWAIAQPWWAFDASVLSVETTMLGIFDGVTMPVWVAVLWIVSLGTLAPYAMDMAGLRHLQPTTAGVVGTFEPVAATVVAWVWLHEILNGVQLAGGFVVLAGIVLVQLGPILNDRLRAAVDRTPAYAVVPD
ncbi:MAG: EamA family transporter [Acidimicrobiales bacterium]